MAELTITAASVATSTGGVPEQVQFGATITQGCSVYLDTSTGLWGLADNNGASAAISGTNGIGIALTGGSSGQYGLIQRRENITIGATVAVGATYCVGATPGSICLDSDVGTGGTKYKTILGVAISTTVIKLVPNATGVLVA
jgi:hypothetical protein